MKTILIADDMKLCLELVGSILRSAGFDVLTATDGHEIFDVLSTHEVDLILLDIIMPKTDGITVLSRLRKEPRWAALPVILLSDAANKEYIKAAARLGIHGYLLKSGFNVDSLLSRVKAAIGPKKASGTTCSPKKQNLEGVDDRSASGTAMTSADVLDTVRKKLELKSAPPILGLLQSMGFGSRSTLDEIVTTVRQDAALTLKIMKYANSTYYTTGQPVQSLTEAIQRIGLSGLRNAATAVATMEHFTDEAPSGLVPQRFWEHSIATAKLAQAIGESLEMEESDDLFLAGLLHNIGRMLLSSTLPTQYNQLLEATREQGLMLERGEEGAFGLTSSDITAAVLRHMKLSDRIVVAASQFPRSDSQISTASREALVVALANRLTHAMMIGCSGDPKLIPFAKIASALSLQSYAIGSLAREAARLSVETTTLCACISGEELLAPFASEIAENQTPLSVAVVAQDRTNGPFALFLERLGWLNEQEPEVAVAHAGTNQELTELLTELPQLDEYAEKRLGIVLAMDGSDISRPDELLSDRPHRWIQLPSRYSTILGALQELSGYSLQVAT